MQEKQRKVTNCFSYIRSICMNASRIGNLSLAPFQIKFVLEPKHLELFHRLTEIKISLFFSCRRLLANVLQGITEKSFSYLNYLAISKGIAIGYFFSRKQLC